MKKNRIALIVTILLACIAAYFVLFRDNSSTLNQKEQDFAVKDTASVYKIFMANNNHQQVTLTRVSAGTWKVNNKYIARRSAINTLLYTMNKLEVKMPIGKNARNNIIKRLAAGAVKVEIYDKDNNIIKKYYVGGPTQDQLGTYMLLSDPASGKNARDPFVMYIPGFSGYLTSRYFLSEKNWRSQAIFRYFPYQIKTVKVAFPKDPVKGYQIAVLGEDKFSLVSLVDNKPPAQIDTLAIKQYLTYYQNINFENIITGKDSADRHMRDSITSSTPVNIITLTDTMGRTKVLKLYTKPTKRKLPDRHGGFLKYDPDRLYGLINHDQDFVVVQYYALGKLMETIDYFEHRKAVKK